MIDLKEKKKKKKRNWPKAKEKPEGDISCLLAMIMPTELIMFIAHAPTSDTITEDGFFSSIYNFTNQMKNDGQQFISVFMFLRYEV